MGTREDTSGQKRPCGYFRERGALCHNLPGAFRGCSPSCRLIITTGSKETSRGTAQLSPANPQNREREGKLPSF